MTYRRAQGQKEPVLESSHCELKVQGSEAVFKAALESCFRALSSGLSFTAF